MPKNVTISVTDELAKRMEELPEVNWSEIGRKAFADYLTTREPLKSGILKNLEEYLRSKGKTEEERREPIRRTEINRFTQKWGEPDSVHPDTSPGAWPPYVFIRKTARIKRDGEEFTLEIENGLTSMMKDEKGERRRMDLAVIRQRWKDRKDVLEIAEYLNSTGFGLQLGEYIRPITEAWTRLSRQYFDEAIRNRNKSFELLFAFDNEDTVFLGFQEVPTTIRWPPMPWREGEKERKYDAICHMVSTKLYPTMDKLIAAVNSYGVPVTPEEVKDTVRKAWEEHNVWFTSVPKEYLETLTGEKLQGMGT